MRNLVTLVIALGLVAGCKKKATEAPAAGSGSSANAGSASSGGSGSAAVATAAGTEVGELPVVTACPKSLGGTERVARTITKACGPIVITETLTIAGSLTLEAGVVLKFQPDTELVVGYNAPAKLIVKGGDAADQRVVFTSNGDKAAGVWKGLSLYDGADRSQINGLDVEYAGTAEGAAVTLRAAIDVAFTRSSIKHARNVGLEARDESSFSAFTGNTFDDIAKIAMTVDPNTVGTLGTGNTFGKDAFIEIRAGKISTNATWKNVGAPFHVVDEINVNTASTPTTLTLADVTLAFASTAQLAIGYGSKGKLIVTGPATLTSLDGKPGTWKGLTIYDGGEAKIDNATFSAGGADDSGVVTAKAGAALELGAVTFKDNKVGLWLEDTATLVAAKPLTFSGNERAAHVWATSFGAFGTANVYADGQIIEIEGGRITAETTWSTQAKAAVQILDEVKVEGNHTLTITAGGTYAWKAGTELAVGYGGSTGTLKLNGTAEAPVVFSALVKGDTWNGLKLYEDARAVAVTQLILADVGGDGGVTAKAGAAGKLDHVSCARCAATFAPECNAKIETASITAGAGSKVAIKKPDGC